MQKNINFFSVFLLHSKDLNLKAKSSKNSSQAKVKLPDFKNCLILTHLKCIAFRT